MEGIILSKVSQIQNDLYHRVQLYHIPGIVKFIDAESRRVVTRCWGEREMVSYCLMDIVSVWDVENVLEMASDDGCTIM